MATSPWPTIHAERAKLAEDLAGLTEEQWRTPSLCPGWSVLDMAGHIVATAKLTPPGFVAAFAKAGFSFDKLARGRLEQETAAGSGGVVAELRRVAGWSKHPPGPVDSWLGEAIVHAEDIRRPLGIAHAYPTEAVTRLLDFYKTTNLLIGAKSRFAGLTLRATDAEWSHGDGPEVTGPAIDLLLATTGRAAGIDRLSGDGVETLRSRI